MLPSVHALLKPPGPSEVIDIEQSFILYISKKMMLKSGSNDKRRFQVGTQIMDFFYSSPK